MKLQKGICKLAAVSMMMMAGAFALTSTAVNAQGRPPEYQTFYVSKAAAPAANNDGCSWSHAWNDVDEIDWARVGPGDTIVIDGGASRMIYRSSLRVGSSGTPDHPIRIISSFESGRNGMVQLWGDYQRKPGIDLGNQHDVVIQGHKWSAFLISGFRGDGIVTGRESDRVQLKNLAVADNGELNSNGAVGVGIRLQGGNCRLDQMIVHDNSANIEVFGFKGSTGPVINRCWIGNNREEHIGISPGIRIQDVSGSPQRTSYIHDSIIGPGLSRGLVLAQKNQTMNVENCLFINNAVSNVEKVRYQADPYTGVVNLRNITSFMTPLNANGRAHTSIDFLEYQESVYDSIVYGGVVNVTQMPNIAHRVGGNVQFKTSGNTTFLSPTQTDPRFTTDVSDYDGTVPVSVLQQADFSVRPGSPATGKGSRITSLRQLFGSNE